MEAALYNWAHAMAPGVALVRLIAGNSSVAGAEADFVKVVVALAAAAENAVEYAVVELAAVAAEKYEVSSVVVRQPW